MEFPLFVVGDVHGHHDRLEALLEKAGLLLHGERTDKSGAVAQLGDLINATPDTLDSDLNTLEVARKWVAGHRG